MNLKCATVLEETSTKSMVRWGENGPHNLVEMYWCLFRLGQPHRLQVGGAASACAAVRSLSLPLDTTVENTVECKVRVTTEFKVSSGALLTSSW